MLTYLKNQKAKEAGKRDAPTPILAAPVTPKHVTKLGTHTITTTALPPRTQTAETTQSILQRLSNGSNKHLLNEDLKLSTVLNLKRFSGNPAKPLEAKTSEEQKAELETIEKMQKRIQVNVQALNGHPLNTTEIASHCKRLMIAYNIGQRLFAKHVMNQVVKVRKTRRY